MILRATVRILFLVLCLVSLPSLRTSAQGSISRENIVAETDTRNISPSVAAPAAPNGTNDNWEGGAGTSGTNGPVRAAVWSEGKLIVAGEFSSIGGTRANGIGMWDGSEWRPLGEGITGDVYTMLAVDGLLYIGGDFTRAGGIEALDIVQYDMQTGEWAPLGKGIGGIAGSRVLSLAHDGERLYAGGNFIVAGTTVAVNIAAWNGTMWERVGTGANRAVAALHFDGEHLYAGGQFSFIGDRAIDRIARYSPDTDRWEGIATPSFEASGMVATIASDNRYVYIGGRFSKELGSDYNNIARYDRTTGQWDDMLGGVTNQRKGSIQALASDPDGIGPVVVEALALRGSDLLVGGDFDNLISNPRQSDIDATNQPRDIAKWNTASAQWSMFPRTSSASGKSYPSTGVMKASRTVGSVDDLDQFLARDDNTTKVYTLAPLGDGRVYVGGYFDIAGPVEVIADVAVAAGQITLDREAVFATNITLLSGNDTVWSAVGIARLDGTIHDMADDGSHVYAAGDFIRAGSEPVNGIARLNPTSGAWESLNGGLGGDSVVALAIEAHQGKIYVGGNFTRAGGGAVAGLAVWDPVGSSWSSVGGRSFTNVTGLRSDGERLAVVGAHGLAIWNGSAWYDAPGEITGRPLAVAIDGKNIYVGGIFSEVAGNQARNAVAFNIETETWDYLAGGIPDTVFAIEAWQEYIYFGGNFYHFGSTDLVRWNRGPKRWERVGGGLLPFGSEYNVIRELHLSTWGVYIGGFFDGFGVGPVTNKAAGIALWDGTTFRTLGSGITRLIGPGEVTALASNGEQLHVAGAFAFAGLKPAAGYAEWTFPEEEDLPPPSAAAEPAPASAAPHPDDIYWDDRFDPAASPPGFDNEVFAMTTTPDGRSIYVGGVFSRAVGADISSIALWDGVDWQALDDGSAEGVNGFVFALAIDGDNLYVGGQFTRAGSVDASNIAVWNMATRTWSPLGAGITSESGQAFVSDIVIADGKVYTGGTFGQAGGSEARSVAVWDGSSWSPLGTGVEGSVNTMAMHEGKLHVGGQFGRAGDATVSNLAVWDGSSWTGMGGGVDGVVNDMEIFRGRVIIGGTFSIGGADMNLAVWNGSQVALFTHQSGKIAEIRDMLVVDDRIYVGGDYAFDPDPTIDSQKFNFGPLTNVGFQFHDETSSYTPWTPMDGGANGPVNALATLGDNVVAGGGFTRVGEVEAASIAGWDVSGRSWYPLVSARLTGPISALAFVEKRLYGAGPFTLEEDDDPFLRTNQVAWLGSSGWHRVEGNIHGEARTAITSDESMLVGGTFIGGGNSIAVNVLSWRAVDSTWHAISPGSGVASHENLSYVLSIAEHGDDLYVGGNFTVVDTFETPNVAHFDRASGAWKKLGAGLDNIVRGLATAGDGTLYAAGDFRSSGSTTINGVARWSGTAWEPLGSGITGSVKTIAIGNGRVFVGGTFKKAGEVDAINVAAWNIAEERWEPVGQGLTSDLLPGVDVLRFIGDRLFAGGFFRVSGADSMQNIARYNGSGWERLGSGLDFASFEIVGNREDIYVAGSFEKAGSKPSPWIALWHDPTLSVEPDAPRFAGSLLGSPNPTAGALLIRYTLPSPTTGRIVITDATGRDVAELYSGSMEAGAHTIEWSTDGLASGMYVCRLVTREGTVVEKIVVRN